jgi:hypothetical protein
METNVSEFIKEPTLFKALEFVGVKVAVKSSAIQRIGPILFSSTSGNSALLLIAESDYEEFDKWRKNVQYPTEVDIQKFAREAIKRILHKDRYASITEKNQP